MSFIDTYGSNQSIDDTKDALEAVLKISMTGRYSSYFGDYYLFRNQETDKKIELKPNMDLIDNEPIEPAHIDYPSIIYVSGTNRSPELHLKLLTAGLILLKNYEYDAD